MKNIIIVLLIIVSCCIFCSWLVLRMHAVSEKRKLTLEQRQEAFYNKIGKEFIFMKDTTIIIRGSYFKDEYSLSNGLTIDARLVK